MNIRLIELLSVTFEPPKKQKQSTWHLGLLLSILSLVTGCGSEMGEQILNSNLHKNQLNFTSITPSSPTRVQALESVGEGTWNGNASIITYPLQSSQGQCSGSCYGLAWDVSRMHVGDSQKPTVFFQWYRSDTQPRLKIDFMGPQFWIPVTTRANITFGNWWTRANDVTYTNVKLPFIIDPIKDGVQDRWFTIAVESSDTISQSHTVHATATSQAATAATKEPGRPITVDGRTWNGNGSIIAHASNGRDSTSGYGISKDIAAIHPTSEKLPVVFFQWQLDSAEGRALKIDAPEMENATITYGPWNNRESDTTRLVSLPYTIDPGADGRDNSDGTWYVVKVAFNKKPTRTVYVSADIVSACAETLDDCGVCAGDNTSCQQDCAGIWGGLSIQDSCGVCDTDPTNDNQYCPCGSGLEDTINLRSNSDITPIASCTELNANLAIEETDFASLADLSHIASVSGNLTISGNSNLCTEDALEFANRITLGGSHTIDNNRNCADGMVKIAGNTFTMGCDAAIDEGCEVGESPQHEVTLSTYWIDTFEVTVGEFRDCVASSQCTYTYGGSDSRENYNNGRNNHPVNFVTWNEANEYCQWKGKSLPTEAQWEMAARGTDGRQYPWGNETPNCNLMVKNGCANGTMPVGSKPQGVSPYGVHDMSGNVAEWVADWYDRDYYASSPAVDPQGASQAASNQKVVRGGRVYYNYPNILVDDRTRTTYRGSNYTSNRFHDRGFRCAKVALE